MCCSFYVWVGWCNVADGVVVGVTWVVWVFWLVVVVCVLCGHVVVAHDA